jgi:hypothetical protein
MVVRIDDLVEWKDSVDDWFKLALLQTVDHQIDCRLLPFRISAGGPDVVPFYRQDLRDQGEEEQLWLDRLTRRIGRGCPGTTSLL